MKLWDVPLRNVVKLLTKWRLSILQQDFFAVKLLFTTIFAFIIFLLFVFVSYALFIVFGNVGLLILLFVLSETWLSTQNINKQEMNKVIIEYNTVLID